MTTNTNHRPTFRELMMEAEQLPKGEAKLAILDEAVRLADSAQDVMQGYQARVQIVETASFSGFPLRALVAFSWLLGQWDKHEDAFNTFHLLWYYKWVLNKASHFPDITMEQIESLLADMLERYRAYGYSDRTYHHYRFRIAMQCGDREQAMEHYEAWTALERDDLSDCKPCEQHQLVKYWAFMGDDERAFEAAEPMISGRMKCSEVPHFTFAALLLPAYRLNRVDDAEVLQKKGHRLIAGNKDFVEAFGDHIAYLTRIDVKKARDVFERALPLAVHHEDPFEKMMFDSSAAGLLKRMAASGYPYKLRLPASHPLADQAGDFEKLARWFEDGATATAASLDRRNGNEMYAALVRSRIDVG
ncbi:hypothetical protein [Paenibacillus methanolicus]|uniref:Tetratricopeptide repeat protein n=1 Tax=Paenibacillus methanolicus TaxID=582686 RepID=A0A5S5BQR5_9BACL|nr:hypothetical protein [Paenibacillus methanolicus]TYP69531.1 hypothetical protein BCM02_11447 [Paenibacillus methanolicus]